MNPGGLGSLLDSFDPGYVDRGDRICPPVLGGTSITTSNDFYIDLHIDRACGWHGYWRDRCGMRTSSGSGCVPAETFAHVQLVVRWNSR